MEDELRHRDIIQEKLRPGGMPHSDGETVTLRQVWWVYNIQPEQGVDRSLVLRT